MRSSLMVSALGHAAVLLALFWVRTPIGVVVPGPETVQVQLVELGRLQAPPAKPPEQKSPETQEIRLKPVSDESGVKLAADARKKKPKAEPKDDAPARLTEPERVATPIGSAGLRGEVSVDAANFEFTYYLLVIRNRIAAVWAPPAGLTPGGQQVRAVVFFRITRSGELSEVRLERSSGIAFFDQSALRAVTLSSPMPPLPLGFSAPDLGVHFGFEYGG